MRGKVQAIVADVRYYNIYYPLFQFIHYSCARASASFIRHHRRQHLSAEACQPCLPISQTPCYCAAVPCLDGPTCRPKFLLPGSGAAGGAVMDLQVRSARAHYRELCCPRVVPGRGALPSRRISLRKSLSPSRYCLVVEVVRWVQTEL